MRELFLVLGADAVRNMPTWRQLEETRDLATLVIVERAGDAHAEAPAAGWRVERVTIPRLDIASRDLRGRLAQGHPIDGLVPPAVMRPLPNAASTIGIDDDRRGCCLTGAPVVLRRVAIAAAAASAKKGEDIIALDVGDILSITDAFVITSATNTRHVRTIVDEIEKAMKEHASTPPTSVEGLDDATWVLLDYGDIVVHVFLDETRAYYELERLWAGTPASTGNSSSPRPQSVRVGVVAGEVVDVHRCFHKPLMEFEAAIEPHRHELRVHCYRMLGSAHGADDLVQETMVRAWRAYPTYARAASIRTWLYRIATNACLTALESRKGRPLPSGVGPIFDDPDAAFVPGFGCRGSSRSPSTRRRLPSSEAGCGWRSWPPAAPAPPAGGAHPVRGARPPPRASLTFSARRPRASTALQRARRACARWASTRTQAEPAAERARRPQPLRRRVRAG